MSEKNYSKTPKSNIRPLNFEAKIHIENQDVDRTSTLLSEIIEKSIKKDTIDNSIE